MLAAKIVKDSSGSDSGSGSEVNKNKTRALDVQGKKKFSTEVRNRQHNQKESSSKIL
jgi:hypothetical protein